LYLTPPNLDKPEISNIKKQIPNSKQVLIFSIIVICDFLPNNTQILEIRF